LKERSRFAAEIVAATRAAVGPDYPIILRVSQWKQQDYRVRLATTPDLMHDWLMPLVEAGVDIPPLLAAPFLGPPNFRKLTARMVSILQVGPRN
jgi:2,4-dienoyl-CoA reductase-like NADH-dependent reductase (Old Yellow Enzyme family)